MPLAPAFPSPTISLWNWNVSDPLNPDIITYSNFSTPTKTGLLPNDLRNFAGVPLQYNYNPPVPFTDQQLIQFIRQAEDFVEQNGGVTLCETWIASPVITPQLFSSSHLVTTSPGQQLQGVDYDLIDVGYDFFYRRWIMQGWGIQQLRYRPLVNVYYCSFIYPLLSEIFIIPFNWTVQDKDYGMVRFVPATNVQMLPLFAMQLQFMGFANSVPQALYFQYVAGLSPVDYKSRFYFIYQLVLATAAIIALGVAQGSINFGANKLSTSVDGLTFTTGYSNAGAYAGLITTFQNQATAGMRTVTDLVRGGLTMISL